MIRSAAALANSSPRFRYRSKELSRINLVEWLPERHISAKDLVISSIFESLLDAILPNLPLDIRAFVFIFWAEAASADSLPLAFEVPTAIEVAPDARLSADSRVLRLAQTLQYARRASAPPGQRLRWHPLDRWPL